VITRFGLAPRLPGLTVARFQEHWRERHGPIIGVLPGLRRYWQNHALASGLPWPGFDACSEMDADDLAAFDTVFAHTWYLTEGQADERRFVDRSRGATVLTRRLGDPVHPDAGGVRLLTFLRAAPGCGPGDLAATLGEPGRGGAAVAVEAFVRVPEPAAPDPGPPDPGRAAGRGAGRPDPRPLVFDAVEALWFPDSAAALTHLGSAAAERDRRGLAGVVEATAGLLATVHVVPLGEGPATGPAVAGP
jgi:uncharacterized protein (TIGR02118 family)